MAGQKRNLQFLVSLDDGSEQRLQLRCGEADMTAHVMQTAQTRPKHSVEERIMDESTTTLSEFKRELEALTTLRDELKLKAHLAGAELKTQLEDLERRWSLAEEQVQRTVSHLKLDSQLVERKFALLVDDLKAGYQNVKHALERR